MSRKTDSPGFGQVPDFTFQHGDIPLPGTSFSLESPNSSVGSPCPDKPSMPDPSAPRIKASRKGVENAKKRLRAFSIQKKTSITPAPPKVTGPGTGSTVLIGKLCSAKVPPPKLTIPECDKVPKPPKPGKCETYSELKKRTLEEIEDMKRKMELVELGIPLGLVLPRRDGLKGMPTKAMPPIKSFLDNKKVDELIREAKKAKAEGREFKFDYQKLLPGYDNPFQRKAPERPDDRSKKPDLKDLLTKERDRRGESSRRSSGHKKERDRYKERGVTERGASVSREKFDERRTKEDRDKHKERDKDRSTERCNDRESARDRDHKANPQVEESADKPIKKEKDAKETNVNLNDYLVCDSWSLDNETASPKVATDDSTLKKVVLVKEEIEEAVMDSLEKFKESFEAKRPKPVKAKAEPVQKIAKLQPVDNSFTYEIDPDDEAMLDMFDEDSDVEKFTLPKKAQKICIKLKRDLELESQDSKDASMDFLSEEFLESVIKEIKQENLSDEDASQDKSLVEYDMSPVKEESRSPAGTPESKPKSGSTTPEIKTEFTSQRSQYSESGYKSTESGYKSTESGYKSTESGYKPTESVRSDDFDCSVDIEKELEEALENSMSKVTRDSLETWSFVMKICQPLLFRHDRNKCYRETKATPKLWYTENPRTCDCVKDRTVVYGELETCKMALVDRVYGCDQVCDQPSAGPRDWYPRQSHCLTAAAVGVASEWELEDASQATAATAPPRPATPKDGDGKILDREYQRFMAAVYPAEAEPEARSTTPTRQEGGRRKKKKKPLGEGEEKKGKRAKLSDGAWSLPDLDEQAVKSKKKMDKERAKKRKLEPGSASDSSENEDKRGQKKGTSKKSIKSDKSKAAKRRRLEKKYIKRLKAKQKRRAIKARGKLATGDVDSDDEHTEKTKKSKKKKQQKQKKNEQKKRKRKSTSSSESYSSSSSDSDSDSESEKEKKKRKTKKKAEEKRIKKKKDKKKKRKHSSSDSSQSDLFDVDILNNIKTEKSTEDKKVTDLQDFSPRRQPVQPRQEIINVKELQNDLVTNSIHIKQEILDTASRQSEESKTEVAEQFEYGPEKESESINAEEVYDPEKETELINTEEVYDPEKGPELINAEAVYEPEKKTESLNAEEVYDPEKETETLNLEEEYDPERGTESPMAESGGAEKNEAKEFKEPSDLPKPIAVLKQLTEESNHSQGSSQESTTSLKDQNYEKDESHLRPSSQNSNYSFHDVMSASQGWKGDEGGLDNYEMYERMAMEYQNGVASQPPAEPAEAAPAAACRIETVVSRGCRGEIKSEWRPGDAVPAPQRPSRWGLKPGDANIVLTGSGATGRGRVFAIESITSRGNDSGGGYDEAYASMYAASDRLQYGDCFTEPAPAPGPVAVSNKRSLDARIEAVLNQSTKDSEKANASDMGTSVKEGSARAVKRVSFADGYKPGQDSDTEEPPVKKRKKRRLGCPWPCPASHPDHVPLWDALPPPPPPPGSPPPPPCAPPLLLPRPPPARMDQLILPSLHHHMQKFDPSSIPCLLGTDPPPGLLPLTHLPM